jgi:hypothetical protein
MKEVATDLKAIYSASTEAEAEFNLELFAGQYVKGCVKSRRLVA